MRNVAIIGAGQAGLLLAIGLLSRGYRVTLIADRTPDEIRSGPVPAGAVVFDDALSVERELGINFWDDVAIACDAVHIDLIDQVGPTRQIVLSIEASLNRPALCIDQRLKSFRWMQEFVRRGGTLIVKPATIADLEGYAVEHDLVVVATGKGELGQLFPRDAARSPFQQAMRHVSMVVLKGAPLFANFPRRGPKFNLFPGIGEIFSAPMYAKDEVQGMFIGFEANLGGPMDRFASGMSPVAQLERAKEVFLELLPWDFAAIRDAELVDPRATLSGKIVPTVRSPVGRLPSGALVLGIADTVNLHDPIAAQGANNAAKAARVLTRRIIDHAEKPFDAPWMLASFEEIWSAAQYANLLSDKLLLPPEPHAVELLIAAAKTPAVAHRFINGFGDPSDLFPWFADAAATQHYLQSVSA